MNDLKKAANCELRATSRRLWKILDLLSKEPQYKNTLRETVRKEWVAVYEAVQKADFDAAARKDKGQVIWTLFFPREGAWVKQRTITRTPNTLVLENEYWSIPEPTRCVCHPLNAYADLRAKWKLPDPKLMAERAALVASKPRDFWFHEKEAA